MVHALAERSANGPNRRYSEYLANHTDTQKKAVIDLVMQAYMPGDAKASRTLDTQFRSFAIHQIRLFVFAGHDSTSSTICYLLHLLSTTLDVLAKIISEHDTIFGK